MCGIAGIISPNGIQVHHLTHMSHVLQHRGPDGFGYMLYSNQAGIHLWHNQACVADERIPHVVGFAHRRLSILDLSEASLQPMVNAAKTYCIAYNGEIYNYLELRKELETLGYIFQTTGDTEVLLYAYEAWGTDCMQRLNGMWAFALFDAQRQQVILSRDRFGIKPLYYTIQNNTVYFASEIKGLLANPSIQCMPNERIVSKYLQTGRHDETNETFFESITCFPSAHYATINLQSHTVTLHVHPYWNFPTTSFQGSEQDAIEQFRALFFDALHIHTLSDVPVGTCLSGGLDSSSIVCASNVLRQQNQIPNYTHAAFGYCSSDPQFSEKSYMDMVIAATSANMHYIDVPYEQFESNIAHIINAQDEPFGSASIVMQWFVFQHAKAASMKVMLDGQGADEILAGYHILYRSVAAQQLRNWNIPRYVQLRSTYEKEIGPFPAPDKFLRRSLPDALLILSHIIELFTTYGPAKIRRFVFPTPPKATQDSTRKSNERAFISPMLSQQYAMNQSESLFWYTRPLNQILQMYITSYMLPHLLRYEDRNSMAHSIEARVPFLDYRLVDFLFTLPDEWKIKGLETKYVLRKAMRDILPEPISSRKDKIGFKAASDLTFAFAQQHYTALLQNQTEYEQRWFHAEGLETLLNTANTTPQREAMLWRMINTKLWARHHWGNT